MLGNVIFRASAFRINFNASSRVLTSVSPSSKTLVRKTFARLDAASERGFGISDDRKQGSYGTGHERRVRHW